MLISSEGLAAVKLKGTQTKLMPDPTQISDQDIIAELHARGVDPNKAGGNGAGNSPAPMSAPAAPPPLADQDIINELHARGVDPNKVVQPGGVAPMPAAPPPAPMSNSSMPNGSNVPAPPASLGALPGFAPSPDAPYHPTTPHAPVSAPYALPPPQPNTQTFAPNYDPHAINQAGRDAYAAATATAQQRQNRLTNRLHTAQQTSADPVDPYGDPGAPAANNNSQSSNDLLTPAEHQAVRMGVQPPGMTDAHWQRINGVRPTMPGTVGQSTLGIIGQGFVNTAANGPNTLAEDGKSLLQGLKALPGAVANGIGNIDQSLYSGIASKVYAATGDQNQAKAYAQTAEENDNELRTNLKGILGGDTGVVAKIARAAGYAMGGDQETAAATMQNVYNGIVKETYDHPLTQAMNVAMLGEGGVALMGGRASQLARAAMNLDRASKVAEAVGDAPTAQRFASQAEAHAQAAEALQATIEKIHYYQRGGKAGEIVQGGLAKAGGFIADQAAAAAPGIQKAIGPNFTRAFGNANDAVQSGVGVAQRAAGVIVSSAQKMNPDIAILSPAEIKAELYKRGVLSKDTISDAEKKAQANLDPTGQNVNQYDAGNTGDAAQGPVVVGGTPTPAAAPTPPADAPQAPAGVKPSPRQKPQAAFNVEPQPGATIKPAAAAEPAPAPAQPDPPIQQPIQAAPDGPAPFTGPDRRLDPVARQGIAQAMATYENMSRAGQAQFLMSMPTPDLHAFVEALHSDRAAGLLNPVSGLPNRVAYNLADKPPVVAAIDGNGLKQVNDNYGGTTAGDVLLHQIGQVLREHEGVPYHYGGDEYAVNFPDQETAERVMPQVQQALAGRAMQMPNGKTVRGAGFEYGIAGDYDTGEAILKQKKDAMKSAPGALDSTGRVKSSLEEQGEDGSWQPAANKAAKKPTADQQTPGQSLDQANKAQQDADAAPMPAAPTVDARLVPDFPTDKINLDPDRFQYKIGTGKGGNSGSLTDAKAWNPDFAGTIAVWRDPADGEVYAVNGHNRTNLAKRLGVPGMDVRFLDAKDAAEARTQGALINIAEGQGTALDAAKLFKEHGYTAQDLQKIGVNLTRDKATNGLAIANLNDALFHQTMRGELPQERAAVIGGKLPDHGDQATLMQQIGDKHVTNEEIKDMADQIAAGPKHTSETSSLFGNEKITRSLALERAQASAYIRTSLAKDASALDGAANNAERLKAGNNVIDAETSKRLALAKRQGGEIFERTKNTAGPVSEILDRAAKRIATAKDTGEKVDAIKQEALHDFQTHVQETFKQHGEYSDAAPAATGVDPNAAAGSIFDEPAAGKPEPAASAQPGGKAATDTEPSRVQSTRNASGEPNKEQASSAKVDPLGSKEHLVKPKVGGTFDVIAPGGKTVANFPTRQRALNAAVKMDAKAASAARIKATLAEPAPPRPTGDNRTPEQKAAADADQAQRDRFHDGQEQLMRERGQTVPGDTAEPFKAGDKVSVRGERGTVTAWDKDSEDATVKWDDGRESTWTKKALAYQGVKPPADGPYHYEMQLRPYSKQAIPDSAVNPVFTGGTRERGDFGRFHVDEPLSAQDLQQMDIKAIDGPDKAATAEETNAAGNPSTLFNEPSDRPFLDNGRVPSAVREMIQYGQDDGAGTFTADGKLPGGKTSIDLMRTLLEKHSANGYGGIFRREGEGGETMTYRVTEGGHELSVALTPDERIHVRVQPIKEETGGMFGIHLDNSAGMFGGKAMSDVLEHAGDRLTAQIATVTDQAKFLTHDGRYRGSYSVDKSAGDALNELVASNASGRTYAHYTAQFVREGLTPAEYDKFMDYAFDRRARQIEASKTEAQQTLDAQGTDLGKTVAPPPAQQTLLHPDEREVNTAQIKKLSDQEIADIEAHPKIGQAILRWQAGPQNYVKGLRLFTTPRMKLAETEGDFFMSLIAKRDADGNPLREDAPKSTTSGPIGARQRLKGSRFARQATGTAQEYSRDLGEILTHSVADDLRKANLKQFYKNVLQARDADGNRLAYTSGFGRDIPKQITYNGKVHDVGIVEYDFGKGRKGARTLSIGMPKEIADDLADATIRLPARNSAIEASQKLAGNATALQLMTPQELTRHSWRIISTASTVPPVGEAIATRLLENAVPYLGPKIGHIYRMWNTDMTDPANVRVLQRVMEANAGSDRPFSDAFSKSLMAKVPGLGKLAHISHDFLFSLPEGKGVKGFDLRTRVLMEKVREAAEGNADPKRTREFLNQFGQYTNKPDDVVEKLRYLNPFAATALPIQLTEARQLIGGSGLVAKTFGQSALWRAETLWRGAVGTILTHSLLNYLLSGHWPWENKDGHKFDLEAGKDTDGKALYIGGSSFAPSVTRPLRTIGAGDVLDDLKRTGGSGKFTQDAARDVGRGIGNNVMQDLNSPVTNAMMVTATGKTASITRKGDFLQVSDKANRHNQENQQVNNLKAGAGGLNPVIKAVLHSPKGTVPDIKSPFWHTVQDSEYVLGQFMKKEAKNHNKD